MPSTPLPTNVPLSSAEIYHCLFRMCLNRMCFAQWDFGFLALLYSCLVESDYICILRWETSSSAVLFVHLDWMLMCAI